MKTDEFGRDLSLKSYSNPTTNPNPFNFLERFKGMSWAEISYMVEEEEEEEERMKQEEQRMKQEEQRMKHEEEVKKVIQERRLLRQQGMYEMEDGEISE